MYDINDECVPDCANSSVTKNQGIDPGPVGDNYQRCNVVFDDDSSC